MGGAHGEMHMYVCLDGALQPNGWLRIPMPISSSCLLVTPGVVKRIPVLVHVKYFERGLRVVLCVLPTVCLPSPTSFGGYVANRRPLQLLRVSRRWVGAD